MIENKVISLSLWDTAGQDSYDRVRPLSYPDTDVFVICFSLVHRDSMCNVKSKWWPEITHHCPRTPIVLVGKQETYQSRNFKDTYMYLFSRTSLSLPPPSLISQGTKLDLRTDPHTLEKLEASHSPPVTEEEGKELQQKMGAALYLECSSLTQTGLKEVFMEACRIALMPTKRSKKSGCELL